MEQGTFPFDLQRMILGDHPLLFSLEIVVRTVVIYAYALLLLRWLGSRTIGQLSTVEFLLVIALGSAVGDGMFYADVPLLHSLVVVTVVVFANKGLDILIARSRKAEHAIDGRPEILVKNGVLCEHFRRADSMGINELFQHLRRDGIVQLGEVRYAFAEPDGEVTTFRRQGEVPAGLPIVPPWDVRPPPKLQGSRPLEQQALLACLHCGTLNDAAAGARPGSCPTCGKAEWTPAVTGIVDDAED